MGRGRLKPGWSRVAFGDVAISVNDRIDNPVDAGVERYVGLEHLDSDSLVIRRWDSPAAVTATNSSSERATSDVACISESWRSRTSTASAPHTHWSFERNRESSCPSSCRSSCREICSWSAPRRSRLARCRQRSTGERSQVRSSPCRRWTNRTGLLPLFGRLTVVCMLSLHLSKPYRWCRLARLAWLARLVVRHVIIFR